MLKDLICTVEHAGKTEFVYYSFHVLGLVLAFINCLNDAKCLKVKRWKAAVSVIIVYPVIYEFRYVVRWIERLFYYCDGANIIKAFIFLPIVIWPVAKLLKVKQCKINQFFAVIPCIGQGISHIGCIFPGCCHGYVASWGIYNQRFDALCIPVQLFESISALLIGLFLEIRFRKKGWKDDRYAMPIMFVLFGLSRFFLEFLRDNEKVLWQISNPALHCLLMTVVGVLWIICLRKKENSTGSVEKDATSIELIE